MNSKSHEITSPVSDAKALDQLLENNSFVQVPDDFEQQVIQAIEALPQQPSTTAGWWQWLALLGGAIPGVMELLAFMFSLWTAASAG